MVTCKRSSEGGTILECPYFSSRLEVILLSLVFSFPPSFFPKYCSLSSVNFVCFSLLLPFFKISKLQSLFDLVPCTIGNRAIAEWRSSAIPQKVINSCSDYSKVDIVWRVQWEPGSERRNMERCMKQMRYETRLIRSLDSKTTKWSLL